MRSRVCVCVCVFIELHITAQPGPVILISQCYSNGSALWGISGSSNSFHVLKGCVVVMDVCLSFLPLPIHDCPIPPRLLATYVDGSCQSGRRRTVRHRYDRSPGNLVFP